MNNLRNKLWYDRPAQDWNSALPVGNGRLGGMVFGRLREETIQLNEDSIWYGGPRNRINPDGRENLGRIRELLFEGKIAEAEFLATHALQSVPRHQTPYQSLGVLKIHLPNQLKSETYHRELDLDTAIAAVEYSIEGVTYRREVFSSAVDDVLVVRITGSEAGSITLAAELERRPFGGEARGLKPETTLMWGQSGPDGVRFCAGLRATVEGGRVSVLGQSIMIESANAVTLFLAAETTYRKQRPEDAVLHTLDLACSHAFDQMREDHIEDYQRLYSRMTLDLDGEDSSDIPTDRRLEQVTEGAVDSGLLRLYFNFGRYLMISSSRPMDKPLPSNLQGIWNESMTPPWESKYTININTEMNYWPAEICNLADCHLPLFDLVERLKENGRRTACELYGCRGFVAHHNTEIWADSAPVDASPRNSLWPMGGAWLSLHLWEHYQFGLDRGFLAGAYDTLKESAIFFLDWLVEDDRGRLVSGPSNSPENAFILPNGNRGVMCMGPSMDHQIITELFQAVIEASKTLDVDADFRGDLKSALKRLPHPAIGKHGQLMEWADDHDEPEPGHRHISHLFALYPGSQISPSRTPELAQAARVTLERRLAHGGGHTGWSRAWIINFWARLRDGEKAGENVQSLLAISTLPNLFDNHPPFQIDGNFGGIAGMVEMLVQSHADEIHLLPALPKSWPAGKINGVRCRGGYELDLEWEEGQVKQASISASHAGECRVRAETRLQSGENQSDDSGLLVFPMDICEQVVLHPGYRKTIE
ncbi:MAG: glycoside hydrolase family 95 protein [Planctomycetota bacterium]|nr:glycoside hydrolase family 95 protein [Planctomycetota bacterium]MDP7252737.1 glycoside hydrolase family 95 protein [Planctomycetota bacterium]